MIFGSEFLLTLLLLYTGLAYAAYPMALVGRPSVAPIGYKAIGAYSASWAVRNDMSIWIGGLIGLVICLTIATLFTAALGHLRGHFFVAATIGLVFIVQQLAFALRDLTGGYLGVSQPADLIPTWAPWILIAICVIGAISIEYSFQNSVWRAVGDDDIIAASLGISVRKQVMIAGWISAAIGTTVGVMYSNLIAYFDPNSFGFMIVLYLFIGIVAGGSAAWYGPIIGGTIMAVLPEALRAIGEIREIGLGIVLALCAMFLPRGLSDRVTLVNGIRRVFRRRRAAPVDESV